MTAATQLPETSTSLMDMSALMPYTAPLAAEANQQLSERDVYILEHTNIEGTFAPEDPFALHTIQAIELPNGTVQRRLVSEPLNMLEEPPFTVLTTLGWTESMDTEMIKKYQARLSRLLPGIPIITYATYGLDNTGKEMSLGQKLGLSLDDLAEHNYNTWKYLHSETPLIVVPTSFTASVLARVQERNEAEGNPLQIIDQILDEPYLLTCEEGGSRSGRAITFFKHMVTDVIKELFSRTSLADMPEIVKDYISSSPYKHDLAAIGGQGLSLLECTKKEVIAAMLARGACIIQGSEDCLARRDINTLPGAELTVIPGKGHAKGANHRNRARDVARAINKRADRRAAALAIATS